MFAISGICYFNSLCYYYFLFYHRTTLLVDLALNIGVYNRVFPNIMMNVNTNACVTQLSPYQESEREGETKRRRERRVNEKKRELCRVKHPVIAHICFTIQSSRRRMRKGGVNQSSRYVPGERILFYFLQTLSIKEFRGNKRTTYRFSLGNIRILLKIH